MKDITDTESEEFSKLKELEEMCMRVKPAKKKSDIRREMEEEKMVAKFTKKVEKKLNEILKKMEDLCELEM